MSRLFHDAATANSAALALLRKLPVAILGARKIDQVLQVIARHVTEVLGYEDCVIYVRDSDTTLLQAAAWGPKSPGGIEILEPLRLRFGEGVVGCAAETQETQRVNDTRTFAGYVPDIAGGFSELAVPIIYGGEVLGVIDSEHPDVGFYSEADADLISTIAAIAAAQLHAALAADELRATISELKRVQETLRLSAVTDPLTGIGNRRHFEDKLRDAITGAERFALCAMDLDRFKAVNDTLGHHEGDELLRTVAQILRRRLSAAGAVVARVGGDEFTALAPADSDFASLCVATVEETYKVLQDRYGGLDLAISAGLAHGLTEVVWHHADDALYVAKSVGGNRLQPFDPFDPVVAMRHRQRVERGPEPHASILGAAPDTPEQLWASGKPGVAGR